MKTSIKYDTRFDYVFLALLVIFLTIHPWFLEGKLNLFELGLYLPGIDAILNGQVPFRDFFYLRGPFELYVPALLMKWAGVQVWVLAAYFYAGTVVTLIVAAWIGRQVISHRWLAYTMTVVLVARTFPKVVFTFWGGLRYAWGLLAVLCMLRFFKGRQMAWVFAAGIVSAVGLLTSVEIGVSAVVAVIGTLGVLYALQYRDINPCKALLIFVSGFAVVALPYLFYLQLNQALAPFIDSVCTVTTQMNKVFLQTEKVPASLIEVGAAMLNPLDKNFRQMTPLWGYCCWAVYMIFKHRRSRWDAADCGVLVMGLYGLMLFAGSFRNLWASQFEMALQPWKIIQFFCLGQVLLIVPALKTDRLKRIVPKVLVAVIVLSSLIYTAGRLSGKFYKSPLAKQEKINLNLPRTAGMVVPVAQAKDLEALQEFISAQTSPSEPVLMFPEMGAIHFIVQRPAPGRFAHATLAWLSPAWYHEWFEAVLRAKPMYAVVLKEPPAYFQQSYFPVPANRARYEDVMGYIRRTYYIVAQTPSYYIYQLREIHAH